MRQQRSHVEGKEMIILCEWYVTNSHTHSAVTKFVKKMRLFCAVRFSLTHTAMRDRWTLNFFRFFASIFDSQSQIRTMFFSLFILLWISFLHFYASFCCCLLYAMWWKRGEFYWMVHWAALCCYCSIVCTFVVFTGQNHLICILPFF